MIAIQLSHEEALFLAGVLGLPPLLGLGAEPTRAYGKGSLQNALAVAASSLLARGYLRTLDASDPAEVAPEVGDTLRFSAYAEQTLIVSVRHLEDRQVIHFNNIGDLWLKHDSPLPRVHRFSWLQSGETLVNELATLINLPGSVAYPTRFKLTPAVFGDVVSALVVSESDRALKLLTEAGVSAAISASFIRTLDCQLVRYTLLHIRGQVSVTPSGEPLIILQSATHTWLCEESPPASGILVVYPIDVSAFRERIDRLITLPVLAG